MQEATTDRELYVSILQTVAPSPFVIRSEIETYQEGNEPKLPTAKFDIVYAKASEECDPDALTVTGLLTVDGTESEEVVEFVSSKTDLTLKPDPSMSIA